MPNSNEDLDTSRLVRGIFKEDDPAEQLLVAVHAIFKRKWQGPPLAELTVEERFEIVLRLQHLAFELGRVMGVKTGKPWNLKN